jgi:hypothetical protein
LMHRMGRTGASCFDRNSGDLLWLLNLCHASLAGHDIGLGSVLKLQRVEDSRRPSRARATACHCLRTLRQCRASLLYYAAGLGALHSRRHLVKNVLLGQLRLVFPMQVQQARRWVVVGRLTKSTEKRPSTCGSRLWPGRTATVRGALRLRSTSRNNARHLGGARVVGPLSQALGVNQSGHSLERQA